MLERSGDHQVEMRQIQYFLAISETLNFTRAAERCNVAQPALTRAIKALEIELGGELLRRERTLSHLTELGQRILPMLRRCYETAVAAKTIATSISKGDAVPLSVAVSQTVELDRFTPMFRELSRAFPGLELNLRRGSGADIPDFLKSGTADLAIAGPLDEGWSRLERLPLFDEPFCLVVSKSHRLALKDKADFKDIASETLLFNIECEMLEALKARLTANGVAVTNAHQVATRDDALALLKAELGVAIVPLGTAAASGTCSISLKRLGLVRTVSVYTVAGRRRAAACASLLNMLRAADWGFGVV